MIAADKPAQRPPGAKLLVLDAFGRITHARRADLTEWLYPGDLVVANDAATLPASLTGTHAPTDASVEVRLAGRRSLAAEDVTEWSAVVFGDGDFHMRTEDRPPPPPLSLGDRFVLGPLSARVERLLGHPRLVALKFNAEPDAVWAGLAQHGRPIQYAHVPTALALWDVWTPIAGPPVACEPPSAGFAFDWHMLQVLRSHGVAFATITHAAGLSSTGDVLLDAHLPFDEPYHIPDATARAIRQTQARGGRVVAIGTTVVRALEHSADVHGTVCAGAGIADQRTDRSTRLRVADVILSGTHEPNTSHYQLLRAFASDDSLRQSDRELNARGYTTHEFGDSVLIERQARE